MNNIEDILQTINQDMSETRRKEKEIHQKIIDSKYEDLKQREKELVTHRSIDLSRNQDARIQKIVETNNEYLELAKNAKVFLVDSFRAAVPFFAKNLIFVGGKTGTGKSTITANIAYLTISQPNSHCLVITNEEKDADVYNRVVCIHKGFPYVNHSDFTQIQKETLSKLVPTVSKRLQVIDDNYHPDGEDGHHGQTTTLEGIIAILEAAKKVNYSAIIIDYYQGVAQSKEHPYLNPYQVQEKFCNYIDQYKNSSKCPIVVLGQLKEDENLPFKEAIEGRKVIANRATCCLEVKANFENKTTSWFVRKSRFSASLGKEIKTGFDKGKYVIYDDTFAKKIKVQQEESELQALMNYKLKEFK